MAVFADTLSDSPLPAARRAISAALAMALATHEFRAWLEQRLRRAACRHLPSASACIGGEVRLSRMGASDSQDLTPVGDTLAGSALEATTRERGWTVLASASVLAQAGAGIQTGTRDSVAVRGGHASLDVIEVTGLTTQLDDKIPAWPA